MITFAITRNRSVGIDIEYLHRKVDFLNIASHFFTEREKSVFTALSESRRRDFFYKIWTGKEALIKAIGEDPPMDFLKVELSNQDGENTRGIKFIDGQSNPSRWIMKPIFPIEEYVGTLVIEQKHPLNLVSLKIIQA
jgi:4'-phosphopantetheinyl transferase